MNEIMFSIIVVCLNAGTKLKETINSILVQTYDNYEVIIKDGLSTDNSIDLLPENSKLRIIRKKDKGIYDAMNQAIEELQGDYVYFLNCGDYFYDSNVLYNVKKQLERLESDIVYGDIYSRRIKEVIGSNKNIDSFGCYRNVPCHQACFYKASLMRERKFDINYIVRADYDHFLWCFFNKNVNLCYIPYIVANYEGMGFSEMKRNIKLSKREHNNIVRKYMSSVQILRYKIIMFFTFSYLRTWLAENNITSHLYNSLKRKIYNICK